MRMKIPSLVTWLVVVLVFLTGTELALRAQATQPAPPTPIDKKKAELGGVPWNPEWDEIVEKALPPELLSSQVPQDVRRFCPRFYEMGETDKRTFWAYFFQALAGAEAGLNPHATVRHGPEVQERDGVTGVTIRSEGLLQLAYADQKRYGCDFNWQLDRNLKVNDPAKTILQPKNNLECGVKILTNQIMVQHKPLLTGTGYWSTLQPGTPSYRVFIHEMTNPPLACGRATKSPATKSGPKSQIDPSDTTKSVQDDANQRNAPK